jgi:L-serine dehydratase
MTDDSEFVSTFYSMADLWSKKNASTPRRKEIKCAFPYPIEKAAELLTICKTENKSISEIVYENEKSMRTEAVIDHELIRIWKTMLECMYIGCHSEGILPGGLNVRRRAFDMHQNLIGLANMIIRLKAGSKNP